MFSTFLSLLGLVSILLYLSILAFKLVFLYRRLAKTKAQHSAVGKVSGLPIRATIMQPILSGDSQLPALLLQNVVALGTNHHFLWLIDASDTVGMEIGKNIASQYPEAISIIPCPDCPPNVNPKSFKLNIGLEHVVTNVVGVMDDDTSVDEASLSRMIKQLENHDLVTALPVYVESGNLWSRMVAAWVNSQTCLTYLPIAECVNEISINGMFYLIRKEKLIRFNIFSEIQPQLCDDYAVASTLKKYGCDYYQSEMLVHVQTTIKGSKNYFALMHRWMVFASCLLADQSLLIKAMLTVFLGLQSILLWLSWCILAVGWVGIVLQTLFLLVRHYALTSSLSRVAGVRLGISFIHSLIAEHLQFAHSVAALFSRKIRWRSRLIKVGFDGQMEFLS